MTFGLPALVFTAWFGLLACSSAREAEARQSAARIARAIEVLREAPNGAKSEPLRALSQLACQAPDICQTRDQCQAGYALHLEAIALTGAAKLKLLSGQSAEAARVLGSAETKLNDASRKIASCAERETTLRHRYQL